MKTIADELKDHPFFRDFSNEDLEFIAGCGKNIVFKEGEKVAEEGSNADMFYLIRHGRFAIETAVPGKPPLVCQTLVDGNICGWSWLFEPHEWTFDVTALEDTRVIALNGKCLREKIQSETRLGYLLLKKFSEVVANRLKHTRLQLMDIYGQPK